MTDRRKTPDRRSTPRTTPERRLTSLKVRVTHHGAHLLQVPAGTTGTAVPLAGGGNGACSVTWDLERVRKGAATHLFDGDFENGLVEVPT